MQDVIHELSDLLGCEDVLESTFGNGAKVIVYRNEEDGISLDIVEYYDH